MYTRKRFKGLDLAKWTRFDTLKFILIVTVWVLAYHFLDMEWLKIPWTPLALIGTALAFVIGFQNNSAYDRIWEARKIWGGVVNTSRTFGMFVQDMISNEHAKTPMSDEELHEESKTLTYRHIAWMTALRHAMRADRSWETSHEHHTNKEWQSIMSPPEFKYDLEDDLKPYLSDEDMAYVMSKDNKQTAVLYLQSRHIKRLESKGYLWEFSFLQLEGVLEELFTLQGKSERIKNFPYPRQFATLNHYFMWVFLLMLPMALIPQFADTSQAFAEHHPVIARLFIWASIPCYVAVAWVFHTMERIGRTGENPFEGTANDVPISTMARGIEIDLRQNLGENKEDIPAQFEEIYNVQF